MFANQYILMDSDGFPQGLDTNSGGYPFKARSLGDIKYWSSLESVVKYHKMFPKFKIFKAELNIQIVSEDTLALVE